MFEQYNYIQSEYPSVTSDYWEPKARELWDQYKYFEESSLDLRSNVWIENARAYLCRRDLPQAEGMDWATNSDSGESDIWDGINYAADATLNAIMPRDRSYLTMLALDPDDQANLNDIRDLMMDTIRRSDFRAQYGKHLRQLHVYGTSAIWGRWKRKHKLIRLGPTETLERITQSGLQIAPEVDIEKAFKNYRFPKVVYNGPVYRVIDMYDFFMDPVGDMGSDQDIPIIVRFYMTLEDLKSAVDDDGKTPKFKNLDGLEPLTLEQIYGESGSERLEIQQELGLDPAVGRRASNAKFVPVYLFHQPVRRFEDGDQFVDTFFYLAQNADRGDFRVIRVEDNPHANGSRGIYVDTYIDHWNGSSYGISAVEKSLFAWNQKNVIAALGLNAQLASVFPAYLVKAGILQADEELKLGPGGVTTVKGMSLQDVIMPIPAPNNGVQLGEQLEKWYGEKILGQLGAYGAIMNDPTKSLETSKTATQINVEATTGSVMRDNLIEKLSVSIESIIQDLYDNMRQHKTEEMLSFERTNAPQQVEAGGVPRREFDVDRRVVATGYQGQLNKQKEIEDLQNSIQVMTTGNALEVAPQLTPVLVEAIFELLARMGMKDLDKYKGDPMQSLMNNPQIQQMLMQQAQQMAMQMQQGGQPPQQPQQAGPPQGVPNG